MYFLQGMTKNRDFRGKDAKCSSFQTVTYFSAKKQHMLQEMGQALERRVISEGSDANIATAS